MRIIAGALKGRALVTPRGHRTRPTADQVRIALLDALMPYVANARMLDLFAGAGGVGLEALSRGAAHATFVERDPQAVAALHKNVTTLGVRSRARVLQGGVASAIDRLALEGVPFDVVFLDPPYEGERAKGTSPDLVDKTLERLGEGTVITADAVVVAQHMTKQPPHGVTGMLTAVRQRRFGETTLTFFRVGTPNVEPSADSLVQTNDESPAQP